VEGFFGVWKNPSTALREIAGRISANPQLYFISVTARRNARR
jgi:hypothetical protein